MTPCRALILSVGLAAPRLVCAQASGPYVSLGLGADVLQNQTLRPSGGAVPEARDYRFDPGPAGYASLGYGIGGGIRLELEGDYALSHVRGATFREALRAGGSEQEYGGFVNALQDFSASFGVTPFVGLGAGYQALALDDVNSAGPGAAERGSQQTRSSFAYQGIAGISTPIGVGGLDLTAEYRMVGVVSPASYPREAEGVAARATLGNSFNHELLIGLRLLFGGARPRTEAPASPAASVPAPAPARSYLVFFDWDKADLTGRARDVIAEAARASARVQTTRIEVDGYADLSGGALYNKALSLRRADAVAAELVRDGVASGAIAIEGFGENRPLVPTAGGVREPQNRRVEVIIKQAAGAPGNAVP